MPSDEETRATLEARAAIDTSELPDGLESSDKLIEAFADKHAQQKDGVEPLDPPTADEEQITASDFAEAVAVNGGETEATMIDVGGNGEKEVIMEQPSEHHVEQTPHIDPQEHRDAIGQMRMHDQEEASQGVGTDNTRPATEPETPKEPEASEKQEVRQENAESEGQGSSPHHVALEHLESSELAEQTEQTEQAEERNVEEHQPTDAEKIGKSIVIGNSDVSVASKLTAEDATRAAALAAASVRSMPLPQGLPTSAAYQSFAQIAPNGTPLLQHALVSVSMPVQRRAVRIAPMGVLPLPPQGANALVPDLQTVSAGTVLASGNLQEESRGGSTIGEMPKGKRRGASSAVIPSHALTPEERTKQKRMLRNRESAARSRDKRKTRNLQLETSIAKHRAKKVAIEKNIDDLKGIVETIKEVLKKHNLSVPT